MSGGGGACHGVFGVDEKMPDGTGRKYRQASSTVRQALICGVCRLEIFPFPDQLQGSFGQFADFRFGDLIVRSDRFTFVAQALGDQ